MKVKLKKYTPFGGGWLVVGGWVVVILR